MGTEKASKFEAVEQLYAEADVGVSAETVLRAFDPVIDRRLGFLLEQFVSAEPKLEVLLDLRAKIAEVWRIRKELKYVAAKGKKALDALHSILEVVKP